jgi:hydrogenase expression/formation protein HypC
VCLGIPGEVRAVSGQDPLTRRGRVRFGTVEREVSLAYVPDCVPGDYVIVHVGFAIGRIDVSEAKRIFDYLEEMDPSASSEISSLGEQKGDPDALS